MVTKRTAEDILRHIVQLYEFRSDLFSNDGDCAATLAYHARIFLQEENKEVISLEERVGALEKDVQSLKDTRTRHSTPIAYFSGQGED